MEDNFNYLPNLVSTSAPAYPSMSFVVGDWTVFSSSHILSAKILENINEYDKKNSILDQRWRQYFDFSYKLVCFLLMR